MVGNPCGFSDQDDGCTVLDMKTSGWYEVKRWILSFGAEAKVLGPEELRDDIAKEISSMADCY